MKSAIAFAAFSAATISLQGCGDGGTTTTAKPTGPAPAPPTPTTTSSGCGYDPSVTWSCPTTLPKTTFNDMHDGDTKNVMIGDGVMTISGTNWTTALNLNPSTCSGSVNFTVPNKTDHPDGNLTVVLGSSYASESSCQSPSNFVMSFSMPGDTGYTPVNQWIASGEAQSGTNYTCFPEDQAARSIFYADMADGDQKVVVTDCGSPGETCSLHITPKNGTETWSINASIYKSNCSGMVDFNVTGKPSPPPWPLLATFRVARWYGQSVVVNQDENPMEYFIEWTHDGTQLNQWVEVGNPSVLPTTAAPSIVLA